MADTHKAVIHTCGVMAFWTPQALMRNVMEVSCTGPACWANACVASGDEVGAEDGVSPSRIGAPNPNTPSSGGSGAHLVGRCLDDDEGGDMDRGGGGLEPPDDLDDSACIQGREEGRHMGHVGRMGIRLLTWTCVGHS